MSMSADDMAINVIYFEEYTYMCLLLLLLSLFFFQSIKSIPADDMVVDIQRKTNMNTHIMSSTYRPTNSLENSFASSFETSFENSHSLENSVENSFES